MGMPVDRKAGWVGIGLMALATGCFEDPGVGRVCTEQWVYGLTVTVTHAESGDPLADVAVSATGGDDDSSETFESGLETGTYIGLGEKTGAYEVSVSKDGFVSQSFDLELELDSEGCHVVPQTRSVALAPAG